MGFKETKKKVLHCLRSGEILHETRDGIDKKNLLSTGEVTPDEVIALINKARGSNYSSDPHHFIPDLDVHIIKIRSGTKDWYIKWYLIEPNCIFISVHH